MHINAIDLNLLRLFDAVYAARSVSRAADALEITQPAASQGLSRLRLLLRDPLFMRSGRGVQPTPRADRLAEKVRLALVTLGEALDEPVEFAPQRAQRVFRIHMSDIGEGRFLPGLMQALREAAPGVRIETAPLARTEIAAALDAGRIDFAFGFLPMVKDTRSMRLLSDRYILLLRKGHPFVRRRRSGPVSPAALRELEFVSVRTHADAVRILQLLGLEHRVRLVAEHFLALPDIVKATDLAVVMPRNIARTFAEGGGYSIVEPPFPLRRFTVSLHWSRRFEADPGNRWLRGLIKALFGE